MFYEFRKRFFNAAACVIARADRDEQWPSEEKPILTIHRASIIQKRTRTCQPLSIIQIQNFNM